MIDFSVIIPMYNAKKTIVEVLRSVLQQTYRGSVEVIIVDDGSDDGSYEVVEEYIAKNGDLNIKLIKQQNYGVSAARNRAIRESNGEYIAFLDADDMWHPEKLEIIKNTLLFDGSIKIIGHNFTLIDNFSNYYEREDLKKISFYGVLIKNFAVTSSVVIKKEIVEFFNEEMRYTEDHELWLRISLKNDLYYCNLPLVLRQRALLSKGGLSENRWKMRRGEILMYKNIIKYKKRLALFFPFLTIFSLIKHLRVMLKEFFCQK